MKLEDHVREALKNTAATVEPASDAWPSLERSVEEGLRGERSINPRVRLTAVAAAAVLSLVSGLLLYRAFSGGLSPGPNPPAGRSSIPHTNGVIAFVGPKSSIYTLNPDGSVLTNLGENRLPGQYDPVFSPDGTKVAFVSYTDAGAEPGANYDIFVMNSDGSGLVDLTTSDTDVRTGSSESNPVWSPDGTELAFVGENGLDISVVRADGSSRRVISSNLDFYSAPSWSPDGTRIAFAASTKELGFDIYVVNADGTGLTRLTSDPAEDDTALWSPDGSKIAFIGNRGGSRSLYMMEPDGSNQIRLTSLPVKVENPAWSPDGAMIAFDGTTNGDTDVFVVDAIGKTETDVSSDAVDDGPPTWAPDGSLIAYEASRVPGDVDKTGTFDIYVARPDGSHAARLSAGVEASGFGIAWQPL